jgi:polyhydroxyalkanoate synthase
MSKDAEIKEIEEKINWNRNGPKPINIHIGMALSRVAAHEISSQDAQYLIQGIKEYQKNDFSREIAPLEVYWQKGDVKLLFCPAAKDKRIDKAIILIPSLINGSKILDLLPNKSFTRFLAENGFDVFLLDWGSLQKELGPQSLEELIDNYLLKAFSKIEQSSSKDLFSLGYCMGGTLLAAALSIYDLPIKGSVFLASPWDFHAGDKVLTNKVRLNKNIALNILSTNDYLPMNWTQTVFATVDPDNAIKKFKRFLKMKPNSHEQEVFIIVEDWLNEGNDIPSKIAKVCIEDWYDNNLPQKKEWFISNRLVNPEEVSTKTLIVASKKDRLVPYQSSIALNSFLAQNELIEVNCGHIGMMAGKNCIKEVWQPVINWIKNSG